MIFNSNKPIILMIDNEPLMIDRRIILEAQTLVNGGYRVVLATQGDETKATFEIQRGLEVFRFNNSDKADSSRSEPFEAPSDHTIDRRVIQAWIYNAENESVIRFIKRFFFFLPRKVRSLMYLLAWPPMMANYLASRFSVLKAIFGRAYEPLVYLFLLRPLFLFPYIRVSFVNLKRLLSFKSLTSDDVFKLYPWQSELRNFALTLKPDVIHVHDLPNLALGKDIASVLHVPLIYDAHELYPQQYFSSEKKKKRLLDLEKRLIKTVDSVITVNEQCVDILKKTYLIDSVYSITNATESPADFNPSDRAYLWHERFNLDRNVKIMVFQGGINPVRNIDLLIYALSDLADHIHIGFITYRKDVPYYESLSKKLGVFHRIHYVLEIPWDEVIPWLASADVGVMPYQATSFNAKIASPNKLYEFVVAGIPIIASSDLENVKEAVERDGLGIVEPLTDKASYVSLIMKMFDSEETIELFRTNVFKARNSYLWEGQEFKLLNIYKDILDSSFKPKN